MLSFPIASRSSPGDLIGACHPHLHAGATSAAPGGNERLVGDLLTTRSACLDLLERVAARPLAAAREAARQWALEQLYHPDWPRFPASVELVYRTALYPWTGVYASAGGAQTITLIGDRQHWQESILYVNETRIRRFALKDGAVLWPAQAGVPHSGVLQLGLQPSGARRLAGKIWGPGQTADTAHAFVADGVDPERSRMAGKTALPDGALHGSYALRSHGRLARAPAMMTLSAAQLAIDGVAVAAFTLAATGLCWTGGPRDYDSGSITFVRDPVIGSIELYGECRGAGDRQVLRCCGARLQPAAAVPGIDGLIPYGGPAIPMQSQVHLARVAAANLDQGGLMLWHKWEQAHLASLALAQVRAALIQAA